MEFRTNDDLVNALKNFKGNGVCSMELTTKVTMNVKGHKDMSYPNLPFGEVFKGGEVFRTYTEAGNFNLSYENAVNNQRKREGNTDHFTANSLPFGEWIEGGENKIFQHKGEYFLRYYVGMNANSKADKKSVYHYADGSPLTEDEVRMIPHFQKPKTEKDNTETRQETVKPIEPRGVKMDGVKRITVGGETFTRV